jgi:hypothetical protein
MDRRRLMKEGSRYVMMPDQVTIWQVRLSHHRPADVHPEVLAESWGSDTPAPDAVEAMFGCIPFPWCIYTDVADTPEGLEKRLARMHSPERLFQARQDRIRKRVMERDPMFYDQMVRPALKNDAYDRAFYRDRQKQIAEMYRKIAVPADLVGRIRIHPAAEQLKQFDWPAMARELQGLVLKMNVYEAQDMILEKHGVKERR